MLHVLNGDATATVFERTSIPGERIVWQEALVYGPTPAVDGSEWYDVRADHLAETYDFDLHGLRNGLIAQDELLARAGAHGEVVLWFEPDLFCQANMLGVLHTLAHADDTPETLSLVCVDQVDGVEGFRGFGELEPLQLVPLFEQRVPLTDADVSLALRAWAAWRSGATVDLDRLIADLDASEATGQLGRWLGPALRLQRQRIPAGEESVGIFQRALLGATAEAVARAETLDVPFDDVLVAFWKRFAQLGLGDAQVWAIVLGMAAGVPPLLSASGSLASGKVGITRAGVDVLRETTTVTDPGAGDRWVGGVRV